MKEKKRERVINSMYEFENESKICLRKRQIIDCEQIELPNTYTYLGRLMPRYFSNIVHVDYFVHNRSIIPSIIYTFYSEYQIFTIQQKWKTGAPSYLNNAANDQRPLSPVFGE